LNISICQAVLDARGHFLFVCKPDSHKAIEEFRVGITLDQRVDRIRSGQKWVSHRYQWLSGVPLRGDEKAMTVNWLMIEISWLAAHGMRYARFGPVYLGDDLFSRQPK
jgi:hypothetical protein